MKKEKKITMIGTALMVTFLYPWLLVWMWNWQLVRFGLPEISYWDAFWLRTIVAFIVKGK